MKQRLMEMLACPVCKGALRLVIFKTEENNFNAGLFKKEKTQCRYLCYKNNIKLTYGKDAAIDCRQCYDMEIKEGVLKCGQGHLYPIIDSIPRMLQHSIDENAVFLDQYKGALADLGYKELSLAQRGAFLKIHGQVQAVFGYEWLKYDDRYKVRKDDEFFNILTEFTGEELDGRLLLDAGCGMGRYSVIAYGLGAEVVGADLSLSVVKARELTKDLPFMHFLQADIFMPPFKEEAFDAVMSIGLLEHTPDPSLGFSALSKLLKRKGTFALWVHGRRHPIVHFIRISERRLTSRLPYRLLYALCFIAVPVGYVLHIMYTSGNKILKRCAVLFIAVFPTSMEKYWKLRVQETFNWYAPKYRSHHKPEEVVGWFKKEGYDFIKVLSRDDAVKGVRQ